MIKREKKEKFIVNCLFAALVLAIVFLCFKYIINLIWPFFWAFIFASLLRPLIRLLNKKARLPYRGAATLSLIVFFLLLGGLFALLFARTIALVNDLTEILPTLYNDFVYPAVVELTEKIELLAGRLSPEASDMLEAVLPDILGSVASAASTLSGKVTVALGSVITQIPKYLLSAIICGIATIFIAVDFPSLSAFVLRQLPRSTRTVVKESGLSLKNVLLLYGKSYGLIMLITFSEILVGLLLIGQGHAALIAFAVALFDIFPIVGSGMILLPWAIITLLTGDILRGIGLLVLYAVVVTFRQFLEPKVVGRHVGLHPLLTLVAMYVGSKLFGGIGLLGLPIMCALIKSLDDGGIIHFLRSESDPEWDEADTPAAAPEQENSPEFEETVDNAGKKC